jgi:FkbM family methyltransferase
VRKIKDHSLIADRFNQAARQRRLVRFYKHLIPPGSLCFDVGANVGERSRAMLAAGGRVVAVEPNPDCLGALQQLPVTLIPSAVGATNGQAELHLTSASTISSIAPEWISAVQESGRFEEFTWNRSISVEVTTIDALIAEYGNPHFTKIDIEGYEREALAGLSRPLPLICFEFTPERPGDWAACLDRLLDLGMRSFNLSIGESYQFGFPSWTSAQTLRAAVERSSPPEFGDIYARH